MSALAIAIVTAGLVIAFALGYAVRGQVDYERQRRWDLEKENRDLQRALGTYERPH